MSYLRINNMIKKYSDVNVLDGLNLEIEKGEIAVIIGGSGNGKTTLLRCLNGLTVFDNGQVFIEEKEINCSKNADFGLIFQNFNLFPQYTTIKNITLPLISAYKRSLNKLSFVKKQKMLKSYQEEAKSIALNLLDKIGLKDKAYNYPYELSGGQAQRVAIARALALKPNILCFDEPTSALDPKTTLEVAKIIKDLKQDGFTQLIITHDIGFAKEVADKVYYLEKGKIIDSGNVDEILNFPTKKELINFLGSYNKEN